MASTIVSRTSADRLLWRQGRKFSLAISAPVRSTLPQGCWSVPRVRLGPASAIERMGRPIGHASVCRARCRLISFASPRIPLETTRWGSIAREHTTRCPTGGTSAKKCKVSNEKRSEGRQADRGAETARQVHRPQIRVARSIIRSFSPGRFFVAVARPTGKVRRADFVRVKCIFPTLPLAPDGN
jgi:hypothetical protein